MGLFSDKKKVHINTLTMRVFDDKSLPNSVKVGAIKSIFEEGDMVDYVMEELINNITVKANRAYKYSSEYSHIGNPGNIYVSKESARAEVNSILTTLYGQGKLSHYTFGVKNFWFTGWEELIKKGYNLKTNKFADGSSLDYFTIEIPVGTFADLPVEAISEWGPNPYNTVKPWLGGSEGLNAFPVIQEAPIANPRIVIVKGIGSLTESPTYTREYVPLDLGNNNDYFQAIYETNTNVFIWSYEKGAGTYETLDSVGEGRAQLGSYYPYVHFISDKKLLNEDKDSEDYLLTKKLCKYLDMNADDIFDQLKYNPDIKEVNQVSLMFTVPVNTKNSQECEYNFRFFNQLALVSSGITKPTVDADSLFKRKTLSKGNTVVVADARFRTSISYSGIVTTQRFGDLGKRYSSSFREGVATYETKNSVTGLLEPHTIKGGIHTFEYQVSPGIINVIEVVDLRTSIKVFQEYYTVVEDKDNKLMIPVDKSILELMAVGNREILLARSMHFVFTSYVIEYISFFERGPFKVFVQVLSIAFIIWSAGTGTYFSAALAAGGTVALTAIWSTVILPMLTAVAYAEGAKIFVKVLGEDFATMVAIFAIAYGAYSIATNSLKSFADALLNISNNLIKAISTQIQESIVGVQEEFAEFQQYTQDMYESLEETSRELLGDNYLAMVPQIVFGELPKNYFNRTVHAGNIGVQGMAMVSNFVELSLRLPEFKDTIEGFKYE